MQQPFDRLIKGKYAYSSHSLMISGEIIDVFTGLWKTDGEHQTLVKCTDSAKVEGGEVMCIVKLNRPMTVFEYKDSYHPEVRPLVKSIDAYVEAVLIPGSMVCTIPDFMEVE